MLEARDLCKSYGDRAVVADLSLAVGAGEIVGLLGPNGAGKSTTVGDAVRAGRRPTAATVFVGGRRLARRRRTRGQAPHRPRPAGPRALRGAAARREPASSSARSTASPASCSRSASTRALAARRSRRPRARQAADVQRRHEAAPQHRRARCCTTPICCSSTSRPSASIRRAATPSSTTWRRCSARGKALLYTTHYMEEAERLCDRIVIIDHGRVVAERHARRALRAAAGGADAASSRCDGARPTSGALAAPTGVARPTQDGSRLHVGVAELGRAAPAVLAWLAAHGPACAASPRAAPTSRTCS